MRVIKILSILLFSITLASCGGGGCGATTAFGAIAYSACDKSEENPFQKYFGTWYFCEENIKTKIEFMANGSRGVKYSYSESVYNGPSCTGSVAGVYVEDGYTIGILNGKVLANFPAQSVFSHAAEVDRVTFSTPNMVASLTGSGTSGENICYSYVDTMGPHSGCVPYDSTISEAVSEGGLHLSADGQYLSLFTVENGVMKFGSVASKDSNFDPSQLN